jgi:type 1 glutamine amidotransferase
MKVLVVTGQASQYHNWPIQSAAFKRILDSTGRFDVDVVTSPAKGEDMSDFSPNWSAYSAVVSDYDGDEWPVATKQSFAEYVRNGGGLVVIHAADNAFPNWPEYIEMTGVGGWAGRTEEWGPKVRWRVGKMVLDTTPGTAQHPSKHDFLVVTRAADHPIMRGLPHAWMHANDELYSQLRGPARNLTVLATASADTSIPKGTGENEPILMTIEYGKGRVFHTTLGHVGPKDKQSVDSIHCTGFIVTLQRGTEWAATGNVTQAVPDDFPTAQAISMRR